MPVKTQWDPPCILRELTTSTQILLYSRANNVSFLHFPSFIFGLCTYVLFFVDITSYFQFSQNFNLLNFLPLKGTSIVVSNIGLSIMGCFLFYMGRDFFLWYYLIPYLVSCACHILIIVRIL